MRPAKAISLIISENTSRSWSRKYKRLLKPLPMIEIGLRAKRNLPLIPMYLLLHPADHSLIKYSKPKNTTNTISWKYKNTEKGFRFTIDECSKEMFHEPQISWVVHYELLTVTVDVTTLHTVK